MLIWIYISMPKAQKIFILCRSTIFRKPLLNCSNHQFAGKRFHITGDSPVTAQQILDAMCQTLKIGNLSVGIDNHDATRDEKLMTRFLGDLMPYFSSDIIFDQKKRS